MNWENLYLIPSEDLFFFRDHLDFGHEQWWILGETNEPVASGPPFFGVPLENSTYSFNPLQMFVQSVKNDLSEDLFFFRGRPDFGRKIEKLEMKSK